MRDTLDIPVVEFRGSPLPVKWRPRFYRGAATLGGASVALFVVAVLTGNPDFSGMGLALSMLAMGSAVAGFFAL